MAHALTVKELINKLKKLNPDAIPVICHDGKGHYNFIQESDIIDDIYPYFPNDEPENEKYDEDEELITKYVQIGSI